MSEFEVTLGDEGAGKPVVRDSILGARFNRGLVFMNGSVEVVGNISVVASLDGFPGGADAGSTRGGAANLALRRLPASR